MPPEAVAPASKTKLFEYKAMRADGTQVVGRGSAANVLELDRTLELDGLTLLKAEPSKAGQGLDSHRMTRTDLMAFTSQLATMIHAGVPLLPSLQHLAEHSRSKKARVVIESIRRYIEAGSSLSEAFAAHSGVFPKTYVAMVQAGEMSGTLPEVLRRQGKYLEWVQEVKATTQQAMIYPAVLCLAIVALVVILITFLIPRLVGLFPGGHEDLPEQTKVVLAISGFIRAQWKLLLIGFAVGAVAFWGLLQVRRSRLVLSEILLAIPRLGSLLRMLAVARFATTASALYRSGCDIVSTLSIAGESCGNTFLQHRFASVLERVRGGDSISAAMAAVGRIDPYLVQMTSVAEASGNLGECMESVAEGYNAEVPRVVKWVLGLIEPAVMVFGGIIVAFLLLAAVLPVFKIYETLG